MSLGIAVIGAGMAGKSHAAGYRVAPTLYDTKLPDLRYVSIADVNEPLARATAARYGYERHDASWQAVIEADDVDVISIVVANHLHRPILEAALAAGKHVLCEKPLSDTLQNACAMAAAANAADTTARLGFVYRRAPGLTVIRDLIADGTLGPVLHLSARYWTDYGCDPKAPMSWRYKGGEGTGALADVGSHLAYVAEYLAGEVTAVSGGQLRTVIGERFVPAGAVVGHGLAELSDETEPVENDDYAGFVATFGAGTAGALEVSRVAAGHPNSLIVEVYCANGSASWDQRTPSELGLMLHEGPHGQRGHRRVLLGNDHPYIPGGMPMDVSGVGFGQNNLFEFQCRAFLDEVAGVADPLPVCASLDEGVHNMELLGAVVESATNGGRTVTLG
ncbi:putative dehydrogenase [Kineosphaera limosa]|uniref:Putative oxidoreductase n=1 Tax=Kineosphaera limosa NBRC 100340 TaxID=1184609 RepID=K6WVK6_9MICO|nr:Gfo/Idh/MocA family oxidoreductase [Kineosphaera limosa]NYE00744.1 putative dehydrogenase [Kineosphaera limosa]GAB97846.1 putative oxidoreductase [Kineosphaera limosa NBRC 100340]